MKGAWSDLRDDLGESPGKAGGDCSSPGDVDTSGSHFQKLFLTHRTSAGKCYFGILLLAYIPNSHPYPEQRYQCWDTSGQANTA